jgi:hypothetical protein
MKTPIDNDYSHTLLEQEEMMFYSCLHDTLDAFRTFGIKSMLKEVQKDPKLNSQLVDFINSFQKK